MPKKPALWACACGWTGTATQLLQGPYDRVCPACGGSGGLILRPGYPAPHRTTTTP